MNEPKLAQVFHFDLQGKRDFKYDFLNQNTLSSINWNELQPNEPNFFLVKKDFDESGMYEQGFKMNELFNVFSMGIKTARDSLTINFDKDILFQKVKTFAELSEKEVRKHFNLPIDSRDWQVLLAQKDLNSQKIDRNLISKITYRAFDDRFTYYTGKTKGFMESPRYDVFKHSRKDNLFFISNRQIKIDNISHFFITRNLSDLHVIETANANPNHFPLYLYPEQKAQLSFGENTERTPNLNPEIIKQIADGLGLKFMNESEEKTSGRFQTSPTLNIPKPSSFAPIDVLDYIYAVLHSPSYREKYKEFLKIDFPRVPYPKDVSTFWKLVKLGGEIRQIHLLESEVVEEYITQYPEDGNNVVGKIRFENVGEVLNLADVKGRVYINDSQYFDNVPSTAWEFYIGGYQPAQKWLKDRKDRVLSFEDILHYQKIIVALTETARLMREIDLVGVE